MRAFIAAEIPENIRRMVDYFIKEAKTKDLPIRWVDFENLHITLKFMGDVDDKKKEPIAAALTEALKKYPPFNVDLEGAGVFPNARNPRVLWIGVNQGKNELTQLAGDLEQLATRFGVRREEKRFHPHLTIGRTKAFCKVDAIVAQIIKTQEFPIDTVTFFKSVLKPDGPVYEPLQRFRL